MFLLQHVKHNWVLFILAVIQIGLKTSIKNFWANQKRLCWCNNEKNLRKKEEEWIFGSFSAAGHFKFLSLLVLMPCFISYIFLILWTSPRTCMDLAVIVTKRIFRKDLRGETMILHTILEWMKKRKQKSVLD